LRHKNLTSLFSYIVFLSITLCFLSLWYVCMTSNFYSYVLNCIAWMTYTILCRRTCWIVCKKTHINFRLDDVLDFILIFEWLLKLWHLSQFLSFFSCNKNFDLPFWVPSAGKKCLTIKSTGIAVDENDSIVSCFYINMRGICKM
jgi:hypothetical protein